MSPTPLLSIVLVASSLILGVAAADGAQARKPNVILILADDLGAPELRCYGNTDHHTPNLDLLADQGLRLDTFYATPLCTPTRMCLMTGQYGFRNGFLGMHDEAFKPAPDSPQRNIANHFTIGDLMKSAGYATAMAGKWQLSGELPTLIHDCGFDEYRMWAYAHNLPEGLKHTGRFEDRNQSKPARFWHPSIVENGKYLPTKPDDYGPDLFMDFILDFARRHRDEPFFVYHTSVLTHAPWEQTPDPENPGRRRLEGLKSNVEYLDHLMGRLRAGLENLGLGENTVVIFVGDNGTGGRGKGSVSEQGVRVPFIVWGPGLVKPAKAASRALADLTDIMPTLAELGGAQLPSSKVFDGKSLVPLLRGQTERHRDWIYSYLNDGRVLRSDRWLLEIPRDGRPERFVDCGESRDGKGYRDVTESKDDEVVAARQRFTRILDNMPVPNPRVDAPPPRQRHKRAQERAKNEGGSLQRAAKHERTPGN